MDEGGWRWLEKIVVHTSGEALEDLIYLRAYAQLFNKNAKLGVVKVPTVVFIHSLWMYILYWLRMWQ